MMKYLPVLLTLLVFSLCAAEKRVLYLAGESNAAAAKRAFRDMKLPEPIRFLVIPDASDRRLLETEIAGADLIIANGHVSAKRKSICWERSISVRGFRRNCWGISFSRWRKAWRNTAVIFPRGICGT